MKKVYCKDCIYLVYSLLLPAGRCTHRKNIRKLGEKIDESSWYEERYVYTKDEYYKTASDINKNNDCKWYRRKRGGIY